MLATLVIGLREGLEAALVVGIIAAFLKRNGRGLRAMWVGVALAVAASLAVGIGLSALETALPQAAQEALETVIGLIAVVFVTGMLFWMSSHARTMKRELEQSASAALHDGTAFALAAMAFLAVLKEGFETSVFLLATFRASTDTGLAALGAVIGVLAAVGIGVGIFTGGVRLDLARFFRVTSAFLVVVAAGLVLTAARTAHEAGWLNAGQQPTVDLAWLAPPGSVQGALITGMLGIPADPRLIEVVVWFAYLVPVAAIVYWPKAHRPTGRAATRLKLAGAGALVLAAAALAIAVPGVPSVPTGPVRLAGTDASATLIRDAVVVRQGGRADRIALTGGGTATTRSGVDATEWRSTGSVSLAGPATITLDQLVALSGGRLPVGVSAGTDPGPFTAVWRGVTTTTVWVAGGALLDTQRSATTVLTISGGGLDTSRTVTASGGVAPAAATWHVPQATVDATAATITAGTTWAPEHRLWAVEAPLVLLAAAACLLVFGVALRRAPGTGRRPSLLHRTPRGTSYAVK